MDLCSVFSENYILSAVNLVKSYIINSYNQKIYLYYFNCNKDKLSIFEKFGNNVILLPIESDIEYAYNPKAFFYKIYAINDCSKRSDCFMYSDVTNCFIQNATNIHLDLIDNCLFLAYPYERLTNKYWTTKKCFEVMDSSFSEMMPQYWAAFQAYKMDTENRLFIDDLYSYGSNKDCILPEVGVKKPDNNDICIEHRQDQSILSLLINKYNKHQFYDINKDNKYGDWQTLSFFDESYKCDLTKRILSPRESKFGNYRFIKDIK
jgi:hypothetical protein